MFRVDHTSGAGSNNLSLAPLLQARINHLNLAGRLSRSGPFIPGGANGDIAQGNCIIEGGRVVKVAIKRLRPFKKVDSWLVSILPLLSDGSLMYRFLSCLRRSSTSGRN